MKNNLLRALIPNLNNVFVWLNALLLVMGVFYLGWKSEVVVIAYFLETIIIGVIHVCKLLIVYFYSDEQKCYVPTSSDSLTGFIAIPFFIFHYFFFIFVQSVFVFTIFNKIIPKTNSSFDVFSNYAYLLSQHGILVAFLTLAFSNIAITLKDFFLPGKFRKSTISKLFFQPYLRIFIQQFVTILAIFFTILLDGSHAAALLIIAFRLISDLLIVAADYDPAFKMQLINRLKKNQKPDDAAQTEDSINSFLEK